MSIIIKGMHSGLGDLPVLFLWKKESKRFVTFTESSRYDLKGENQLDWNKLFGVALGGHHHQNSIRYGWRYSPSKGKVEVSAYWYTNGVRNYVYLCDVEIGGTYCMTIKILRTGYMMLINNADTGEYIYSISIKRPLGPTYGYNLRLYFGGDEVAPHTMRVKIRRKMTHSMYLKLRSIRQSIGI
jgi:hypothetical protein